SIHPPPTAIYTLSLHDALPILRWSAAMRNPAERITPFGPIRTALYWTQYILLIAVLGFPLTVYEQFIREHQYGLATQTFGPWLRSEEHTSELQSRGHLVCRLLL